MQFNLYKLCDKKTNIGSIRVILDDNLKNKIEGSILNLKKQKTKFKDIATKIGIKYVTLWEYLNKKESIPLQVLENIGGLTKLNFHNLICQLECGYSKIKVKAVRNVSEDLAKIIGAHVADGSLRKRKQKWGHHYELVIREGYKSNALAFYKWFNSVFNLNIKPKRKKSHYLIYVSNKIIFDYFTKIFEIPTGRKVDIISIPKIIKESDLEIKKAFLQGLFMFDGGVDYRTGYVNLISRSKNLIIDTTQLLKEINLEPDYINLNPDKYGRYKIRFRKLSKLKECLILFEKNTEKWYRLKEHLYGLENTTKDLNIALKTFDKFYPRVRVSSITFSDVIKAVNFLNDKANLDNISKVIKRNKTVTYEFLHKLERWKILKSKRIGLKKYWKLNSIMKIPRRDVYG